MAELMAATAQRARHMAAGEEFRRGLAIMLDGLGRGDRAGPRPVSGGDQAGRVGS